MPTYEHLCQECNHEWEDIYSIRDAVPEECPKCSCKGKVIRLISRPTVRVELTGRELVQKLKAEGKALAKEAQKNETLAANLYGLG
jgi:putative FmdB family regulatory protein